MATDIFRFQQHKYTGLTIEVNSSSSSTWETDINKAKMYTTDGLVGFLYFVYVCRNAGNETVRIILPDGWKIWDQFGIVVRDRQNGNLITCWVNQQTYNNISYASLSTYLHSGTMTVGNTYGASIPLIHE